MDNLEHALQKASLEELNFSTVLEKIGTYCLTEMGRDAVDAISPIADAEIVRLTLDQVQEVITLKQEHDTVPFERFPDVETLLQRSRITGNYLTAPELLNVLEAMVVSRIMRRYLLSHEGAVVSLRQVAERLVDDKVLEKHITDAIDDTGMVRDTASRELHSIRREIHALEARLRSRLQRILKKFGEEELLQDDFITQRDGRFVLPLQVQNKRAVEGIIHGVSQSGQTVFLEPAETYELNNELSLLRSKELREIINILTTLTAEVGSVSYDLEEAASILVTLDTLFARAQYAIEYGGVKPTIVDNGAIELVNIYHPILRHQSQRRPITKAHDRESLTTDVVPLSVRIDEKARGILISGPNAGGKTVAMKAIGLSLSMAFSGIFPLGMCHSPLRRIYTSIGDHQSIDANLSTFSSQIMRMRDILAECDMESLVLVDEICAGTDPAEGGALAAGILDSLLERGSCFVVTTHQSSLKQYALTRPLITNASLAFDEQKMQPTFRFMYGVPGNSYAFDLSRNVGLPDIVLTRAKSYLGNRHGELEESISAMQRFREEAEQLKLQTASEKVVAERMRIDYEERLEQLKAKRSSSIEQAKEEAKDILASANSLIEKTIREIREQQKSASEIKREFENSKRELVAAVDEPLHGDVADGFVIGQEVHVEGTATNGIIIALDQKGHAVLEVNGMKMRISLSELSVVSQTQKAHAAKTSSVASILTAPVHQRVKEQDAVVRSALSLDLRGMRAEEALRQLEMFIDNAVMRNAPFVSIIHGKGTGALREVVHQFLERQPNLTGFRLGSIPDGGDGITIVEL